MQGTCLCGAIDVIAGEHSKIGLCHCSMCRRWSGGPFFAVHCDANVQFNGSTLKAYRSSEWAERGFCADCGTHLYYRLVPDGEYFLPAGLFQDRSFILSGQIFIDEKPDFYALANDTPTLTGKQVFDQFTGGGS